jgi:hypothetical protein
MTRDDIIRMAQQSWWEMPPSFDETDGFCRRLERFANLVVKHEREECAKVCDEIEKKKWETVMHGGEMQGISARDCAAAIRARAE